MGFRCPRHPRPRRAACSGVVAAKSPQLVATARTTLDPSWGSRRSKGSKPDAFAAAVFGSADPLSRSLQERPSRARATKKVAKPRGGPILELELEASNTSRHVEMTRTSG